MTTVNEAVKDIAWNYTVLDSETETASCEDRVIHTFFLKKTKGRARRILKIQADFNNNYCSHVMF